MESESVKKQHNIKQLLVSIQEDRKRYIALEKLLVKQRELMVKHDSEGLKLLNPKLMELYNTIDKTATERRLLMQELQLPTHKAGIHLLISRLRHIIVSIPMLYGLIYVCGPMLAASKITIMVYCSICRWISYLH